MIGKHQSLRFALLAAASASSMATAAFGQITAPQSAGSTANGQAADPAANPGQTDPSTSPQSSSTPASPTPPINGPAAGEAEQDAGAAGPGDIVVTGIRASQQRAVALKRDAASVQDSISAEDIGKLPDVTISDSLQRIPGVQIRRDAGEGSSINIRGLPEVTTLLNGEQYLGANSINSVQPNFNDVPSQLFAGADVIKSSTADLLNAGITGTVNLRTRRPFDLKSGFTFAAAAEGQYGDKNKSKDPSVNGLLSWHNDRFGFLVSAAYTDAHLENSQNGILSNYGATYHNEGTADATSTQGFSPPNRPHGKPVAGGIDINGDGDSTDAFIVPQGFSAFNTITERQRLGINGSAQWKINDSLELTADGFYTHQRQYNHTSGVQQQNINWQAGEFVPGTSRNTGAHVTGSDGRVYDINTTQVYNYDLGDFSSYAQTDRYISQSQDYNAELKFDNGGPLKLSLRGIYGKASQNYDQSYAQFSPSNGLQWEPGGIGHYPTGDVAFNPGGYTVDTLAGVNSLHSAVDFTGTQPVFTLPQQLTAELSNQSMYALKTLSSEGNYRQTGELKIIRADGSYKANDAITFEFGGRYSDRSNSDFAFDRAAPLYAGMASGSGATAQAACLVKWKGFDVPINDASCHAGTGVFGTPSFVPYTAGLTRKATDPSISGLVTQTNPGVQGIPVVYTLNPTAMNDAQAFQNIFYPGNVEVQNPGASYRVGLKQITGYTQLDFKGDLFGVAVQGNAGLKVINTKLDVLQYITGNPQPYGVAGAVAGTTETKRSFTDLLPSFNLSFDLTSKLKLRTALTRTMTLLNLDQWGGGLTPNYAIDTSGAVPIFRVTGGNSSGNPQLDPWRATNFDASLEWYIGRASLLSVAGFYIQVESFIQSGSVLRTDLPDNDGVVRNRTVSIGTPIQGGGGILKGVEGQWQQSFGDLHFMPGFLQNFGINANVTYSPSDSGQTDLSGKSIPFQDNSALQTNLVGYYQDSHLQARIAWNYRSTRAVSQDFGGLTGLELYQTPTNFVDASVSYDFNPHFTLYAQGSNVTGESEHYYLTWADEHAYNNVYERRYTIGARVKF
jgi:TonB-dependent receptor